MTTSFLYIVTLLLQGVALRRGRCETTGLAFAVGLHTVYRETCGDWGMVVVDISDLLAPRYGIVAHPSSEERFDLVTSNEDDMDALANGAGVITLGEEELLLPPAAPTAPPAIRAAAEEDFEAWGRDRLLNAVDFVNICMPSDEAERESEFSLKHQPMIETDALQTIWPECYDVDTSSEFTNSSRRASNSSAASLSVSASESSSSGSDGENILDEYLSFIIQQTDERNEDHVPDEEVDQFTNQTDYISLLWRALQAQPGLLGKGRAGGELLALALAGMKHMALEIFKDLKVDALDALLQEKLSGWRGQRLALESISLCADSFAVHPAVLAGVLARTSASRIYFVRRPGSAVDLHGDAAAQFERDVLRAVAENYGSTLQEKRYFFSSAFCAALRGNGWLHRPLLYQIGGGRSRGLSENERFLSLLTDAYPVRNLVVQLERGMDEPLDGTSPPCFHVNLINSFMTAERFATGLLDFMHLYGGSGGCVSTGLATRLLAFSAAASFISQSTRSAHISRDLVTPFPECFGNVQNPAAAAAKNLCGLEPGEWTALVARGVDTGVVGKFIRYALVRLRESSSNTLTADSVSCGPDGGGGGGAEANTSAHDGKPELEIVGLEAFLAYTAPRVDPLEVRQRLYELTVHLVRCSEGRSLPPRGAPMAMHPIAVLTEMEAKRLLMQYSGY